MFFPHVGNVFELLICLCVFTSDNLNPTQNLTTAANSMSSVDIMCEFEAMLLSLSSSALLVIYRGTQINQ